MFGSFFRPSKTSIRKLKSSRGRGLKIEQLEGRQLLAASLDPLSTSDETSASTISTSGYFSFGATTISLGNITLAPGLTLGTVSGQQTTGQQSYSGSTSISGAGTLTLGSIIGLTGKPKFRCDEFTAPLDLTKSTVTLQNIEAIDLAGTHANKLLVNVNAVKNASATTDTLAIDADGNDLIDFGTGWKLETPQLIGNTLKHILTESATGGTARIELTNQRPNQNPLNRFDVDRDGKSTLLDALKIINQIRQHHAAALNAPATNSTNSTIYFDVSGDNSLSVLDALQAINAVARSHRTSSPESEAVDPQQFNKRNITLPEPSVSDSNISLGLS